MEGILTKEWDDIPYPGIMFFQTSPQEVLQMEPITGKVQEVFSRNKHNTTIIRVGDTILAAATESAINEDWFLLDNQSTFNALINGKYLSYTIYSPDGKYLRVHCNA